MWSYYAPITQAEQESLHRLFPEETAKRNQLKYFIEIIRSRPRLTYGPENTFEWSNSEWIVSDILPPG